MAWLFLLQRLQKGRGKIRIYRLEVYSSCPSQIIIKKDRKESTDSVRNISVVTSTLLLFHGKKIQPLCYPSPLTVTLKYFIIPHCLAVYRVASNTNCYTAIVQNAIQQYTSATGQRT